MNDAIVQGVANIVHSPELAGSWLRRLPKVTAACPSAGSTSRAAAAARVAAVKRAPSIEITFLFLLFSRGRS